jgi:hypothetical protein
MKLATMTTLTPPTYPLRPMNGGPLPTAAPKLGEWIIEAKYNDCARCLIHAPTGQVWNRHGQPLSATRLAPLAGALEQVKALNLQWLDGGVFADQRTTLSGAIVLFDTLGGQPYVQRRNLLHLACVFADVPLHQALHRRPHGVVMSYSWVAAGAVELWQILPQCNAALGTPLYEGVVAKRADSLYPFQLDDPAREFSGWVKHRFV